MKKLKEELKYGKKGITLISLVVTIIVLLILAGVTIAALSGPNGILTQANSAKEKTKQSEDIEKIRLAISEAQMGEDGYQELTTDNLGSELIKDGTKAIVSDDEDGTTHILFLDKKKEYKLDSNGNIEDLNIDFDTKYVAPASQDEERNEGVIGIGTDGKPVDMDLWEYTLLDNGTYALNSKETMEALKEENWSAGKKGYLGDYDLDGNIIGKMPQYIKEENSNYFIAVTNLQYLFYNCVDLKVMPEIPITIQRMENTFLKCVNLTTASVIPNSVEIMASTFSGCKNLVNPPQISSNVTDMSGTFRDCANLKVAPNIPDDVKNMHGTFSGCKSLTIAPQIPSKVTNMETAFYDCVNLTTVPVIPRSVVNMRRTFGNCQNLTGNIIINANITGAIIGETYNDYDDIFWNAAINEGCKVKLSGNCIVLEEIAKSTNNPNITL